MISYQKIISKMAVEIEQAKKTSDAHRIKEHARAIRLLSDLILDEEQIQSTEPTEKTGQVGQTVTDEMELRKMIGDHYQTGSKNQFTEDDEKPGSLLDF